MPVFTKTASEVFASTDGAGNPRSVVNAEAITWGTEVEYYMGQNSIDTVNNNLGLGDNARADPIVDLGEPLLTGIGTVAVGFDIMTTANNNSTFCTFVGQSAGNTGRNLYCCEGFGLRSQYVNSDGQYVAAFGTDTAFSLVYGRNSVFLGAKAGLGKDDVRSSFIGGVSSCYYGGGVYDSVIIGTSACEGRPAWGASATGNDVHDVVAIGSFAGRYFLGQYGVFIGNLTGSGNDISGSYNVAVGHSALVNVSSGASNAVFGSSAGSAITTGSYNTVIGTSATPGGNYSNSTTLGYAATGTADNQITLGNGSIATLRCQVTTITALSDARDKQDIESLPFGLDFIRAVPVHSFEWNTRDGSKVGIREAGIIAQELDEVQTRFGADWLGLVDKTNPDRLEATPGKLLFPLIKAVQEMADKVERMEARLH